MDTALSVAALVVSLFSAGFTLYTFIWTKVRDRKQAKKFYAGYSRLTVLYSCYLTSKRS